MLFDTIAAISTPRGEGGIGIIRISGDKSFEILDRIFNTKNPNRDLGFYKFNYGFIHDNGKIIDEVMAVRMKAPKTYTCEDVVEINCHGGHLISEKVLELVLKNGARHAEQGEFTKRAFMNGRIDLSQAEAVMDIIHGKTEKSISLSLEQLRGDLRDKIASFKKALLDVTAHVNVVLDYPEEGIDDPLPSNLRKNLENVYAEADRLISSYDKGKKIKEGIKTVIAGKPNVGKSTLLNSLLKEERAIVTHIPGTTRDVIEEIINIKGIPLVLTDTAGIIDYTSDAYGVAYVHENETVKLGNSSGWYAGAVSNNFRFKDIGKSRESQTILKAGIFKTMSPMTDHNGSLQWTIGGDVFAGINSMKRKFLVVDDIFEAKSTYSTYGVSLKNELGYDIRMSERNHLRPYGSLKMEYGRFNDIRENEGEIRLEVEGNDYFSVKPEVGLEFKYVQPLAVKTQLSVGLSGAYENELGKVADINNRAKVRFIFRLNSYKKIKFSVKILKRRG